MSGKGFNIRAWLGLDTKQYSKGLKKAKKDTDVFGKQIKDLGGQIAAAFAVKEVIQFTAEVTKLAGEVEGVEKAFNQIADKNFLEQLKKDTKNTVSELRLMQSAVKFNNFNISLDKMGSLLQFAQLRAQQTGESIDYMVDSIVTGLGRKSLMILDNLGLSMVDIRKEMAKGFDMTQAVSNIAKKALEDAGGVAETTATKVARLNAQWEDFKVMIGEAIIGSGAPDTIMSSMSEAFKSIKPEDIKAIADSLALIVKLLAKITAFSLQNPVLVGVIAMRWKSLFKVLKVGWASATANATRYASYVANQVEMIAKIEAMEGGAGLGKKVVSVAKGQALKSILGDIGAVLSSTAVVGTAAFAAIGTAAYNAYKQAEKFKSELKEIKDLRVDALGKGEDAKSALEKVNEQLEKVQENLDKIHKQQRNAQVPIATSSAVPGKNHVPKILTKEEAIAKRKLIELDELKKKLIHQAELIDNSAKAEERFQQVNWVSIQQAKEKIKQERIANALRLEQLKQHLIVVQRQMDADKKNKTAVLADTEEIAKTKKSIASEEKRLALEAMDAKILEMQKKGASEVDIEVYTAQEKEKINNAYNNKVFDANKEWLDKTKKLYTFEGKAIATAYWKAWAEAQASVAAGASPENSMKALAKQGIDPTKKLASFVFPKDEKGRDKDNANLIGQTSDYNAFTEFLSDSTRMAQTLGTVLDSVFTGLGDTIASVLSDGSASWKDFAAQAIQSIGRIASALLMEMVIGTMAHEGATKGVFGLIAAAAAIPIMFGVISGLIQKGDSKVNKYATGGIVPGDLYTGDKVPAMVNSGEMILNQAQQANLFKMINSGAGGAGQVEFKIKGTELVGVLKRTSKVAAKTL